MSFKKRDGQYIRTNSSTFLHVNYFYSWVDFDEFEAMQATAFKLHYFEVIFPRGAFYLGRFWKPSMLRTFIVCVSINHSQYFNTHLWGKKIHIYSIKLKIQWLQVEVLYVGNQWECGLAKSMAEWNVLMLRNMVRLSKYGMHACKNLKFTWIFYRDQSSLTRWWVSLILGLRAMFEKCLVGCWQQC